MFVVPFRGWSRAFSPEELRPLRRAVRRPRRDGSPVVSGWLGSRSCLASQEHSLDPKLSAQQIDHKRLPKQYQNSYKTQNTLKNERLAVPLRQDARRAALAAGAAPTDLCFPGQPHRGDGRGLEPARLDARSLGRGEGLGALRPGERASLAGPGISRVGRGVVESTNLGARRIGRGERVGSGHGTASAAMSAAFR